MMNYVELEEQLINSVQFTYGGLENDVKLELFTLTRSIDWPIVLSDPNVILRRLGAAMGEDMAGLVAKITTGAVARCPALRPHDPDNDELIAIVIDAVAWHSTTKLGENEANYITLDKEHLTSVLRDSPDVLVLFMLSQLKMNFDGAP